MIGAGASYIYLLLLIADVDKRNVEDRNIVMEAEEVIAVMLRHPHTS